MVANRGGSVLSVWSSLFIWKCLHSGTLKANKFESKTPDFRLSVTLVLSEPESPAGLHKCSYIIGWRNTAADGFRHKIENWQDLHEIRRQLWKISISCKLFKVELNQLLFEGQYLRTRKITKIIYFGLGDLADNFWSYDTACHGIHCGIPEIQYTQYNLYNVYYGEWEEEDYEIAEKISNYWVKFIKYGNPNGDGFI
ncbi:unnamed protein product [Clonostachys chloroleuca]|uniref:Uncharacterized protein n=1 Tax=Clonostachys chloroleuca TaxID=1926264 RepID=A0AA35MDW5_9HYPO|nr:unnamed protein product [Clonostachys chloroleuca]